LRKLVLLLIVSFTMTLSSIIVPQKSFAAVDYSGGYLDGKLFSLSDTATPTSTVTGAMTDNNETTYATLAKWNNPSNAKDHAILTLPAAVNVNSIKIKASNYVNICFYNSSGAKIGDWRYISAENTSDGRDIIIPLVTGVKKVEFLNNLSVPLYIYEFNIYNKAITSEPLNLIATSSDAKVNLSWETTSGATGYNIKRSTTSGGPYTSIANNVPLTTYEDLSVINGLTYYYVITAVNGTEESGNSNEAIASPTAEIPDAPTNLTAVGDSELQSIQLSWTSVTGATYYNVHRSITSGGPYTTIASNLSETSYSDLNVVLGTTYYYVVTSINEAAVGSENSNETSAIIEEIAQGRAILTITMTNDLEKEYDLPMAEVNDFIDWYDAKDAGAGPAKYKFIKTWNKGPFKARAEYVVFDKILTFNVDEYDVVTP
jgi:fibronectin type 3 domain-containing protein